MLTFFIGKITVLPHLTILIKNSNREIIDEVAGTSNIECRVILLENAYIWSCCIPISSRISPRAFSNSSSRSSSLRSNAAYSNKWKATLYRYLNSDVQKRMIATYENPQHNKHSKKFKTDSLECRCPEDLINVPLLLPTTQEKTITFGRAKR